MKKIVLLALAIITLTACGDKSNVVYLNGQDMQTKKQIKKTISNDVLLPETIPETKTEKITKIIKKEKENIKQKYENKKSLYKKEKQEKLITLLKEPITPVKTPDTVIRILLLPYVDDENTFHSGEYLFVKVEEGKWILGEYIKTGKKINKEFNLLVEVK